MAIDKEKKSNRLLASRRYTHDSFTDAQESFTEVLDLRSSEIYTQAGKIPSSNLPFSSSADQGQFYTDSGDNILRYYYRHKLTKSNLNNEVWFFLNPTGSASGIGAQLVDDNQQTNFISPKYSVSSLANATTEDSTPGYLAKVFMSTATNSASVSSGDAVSVNNYQFDYKTGVLQFINSSVDPSDSQYVYMSVYQYVGKTLADGVEITGDISGSATSTGSFGHLVVAGNITASGTVRADAFESVTGGTAIDFKDSLNITGNLTASGDLSIDDLTASGNISGSATSTGSFAHLHVKDLIGVGTQSPLATVHISASDGLIIPVGNTSQRSSDAIRGEIRFNTQLQSYEGYDGANWGTLGGMNDVDNDTKITAENSAGDDNDELKFFTAGVERLRIFADGNISASANFTASKNVLIDGNLVLSGLSNPNIFDFSSSLHGKITAITSSISALKTDSGSFSTRNTLLEISASDIVADSASISTRLTTEEANVDALQVDSGSFSTRVTTEEINVDKLQASASALINNFDQVQSLGKTDNVLFSRITASNDVRFQSDLTVDGKVTAQEFHTEIVSSSIIFTSGSTKFGDTIDDDHLFTGSLFISGNLTAVNLVQDSASFSQRITQDSSSTSFKTTAITQSISALKVDSGSFSTRATLLEISASDIVTDSASFSQRITQDSSSTSFKTTAITQSISALKVDSGSFSQRITTDSSSTSFKTTAITASISALKADSGSFSTRLTDPSVITLTASNDVHFKQDLKVDGKVTAQEFHTEIVSSSIIFTSGSTKFGDTIDDDHLFTGSLFISGNLTAVNLVQDSASFSQRITEDSSSTSFKTTAITASISALKIDSGSFSQRITTDSSSTSFKTTAITSSISALKVDSGSFSTRNTLLEISASDIVTDSASFSQRITSDSSSFSQRITEDSSSTSFKTTAITQSISALKSDSGSFSTRLTNPSVVTLTASNDVHFKQNLEVNGNISGSATSTGSFGRVEVAGDSSFTGDVTIGGNIQIGDADSDSLTISADLTSNLIPNADSTFNLGSSTKNWNIGYIEKLESTNITASNNISASGDIFAVSASFDRIDATNVVHSTIESVTLNVTNDITASGNISASGNILGTGTLRIDGNVDFNSDLNISGNITGSNFSGSATSTGSFGRVVTTDLLASGESTLKNKVILKHDSSNAILELRSTGGSRINEYQNFNATQIYNSLFLNANSGVIVQDGTYSGGNARASIFSIGHIDGTLYHQFGNVNQVAKQTGMGILDYDIISGSADSTGSFGNLRVVGMSVPDVSIFSSSLSTRITDDSSSFSERITQDSSSTSFKTTAITASISALKVDSGSFSQRITTDSSSTSFKTTAITASISALKVDSGSFSTRLTNPSVITLTASNDVHFKQDLKVDGRVTAQEFHTEIVSSSIVFTSGSTKFGDSIDDSHSFTGSINQSGSLHVDKNIGIGTFSPRTSLHISASDGLILPVGNTNQRSSTATAGEIRFNAEQNTYEGYDGNNWGTLGGVIDVDQDTRISAETAAGDDNDQLRFFTGGTERLRINSNGHISASVNITSSGNLEIRGNISSSITSTGSFGYVTVAGLSNPNLIDFSSSISSMRTSDSSSFSDRITQDSSSTSFKTTAITASISALKVDSGSFSLRGTNLETTSSALINNFDQVQSLGKTDSVIFSNITASNNISASGNLFVSNNVDVDGTSNLAGNVLMQSELNVLGNITSSANITTSTASFGVVKISGLDNREHFSRNTAEAFELDENGDFQPSDTDHYMVDPKWELDSDGNLQRRERELWTFNWDEYFSD